MKRGILAILGIGVLLFPGIARGAMSSWQKGVSISPRWNTDFSSDSFKESVRQAAETKVNYITLIIPLRQSNEYSTDITAAGNTPTDESLAAGIDYIHSLGLKVNLKIHLDNDNGVWRGNINPGDRNGWFRAYGDMVKKYARIASNHGVEEFTIGTELIQMAAADANSSNTEKWNTLIGEVRNIYSGQLTYSANWGGPGWTDEKNRITFWPALDSIGISAYFPLPTNNPTVESLKAEWDKINKGDIAPLKDRYQKPVVFTEVGYRSMDWAQWAPFNFWDGGSPDEGRQSDLYQALFDYWDDYDYMKGVQLWDWSSDPNAGGSGDTHFTPQNKQAEETMKTWFGGSSGGGTTPPPGGSVSRSYTVSAAASPTNSRPGDRVQVQVAVTNSGADPGNAVVDVEIYNSAGTKVQQQFFEGESFTVGQTKSYTVNWTPNQAEQYVIRVGVFSSGWRELYLWVHNAGQFMVSSSSPSPQGGIEVWWPLDSATVSGVQPLKAIVSNQPVQNYTMYWQVDNGSLNEMSSSEAEYPHKESWIDFGPWNWRGSGPYTIRFVAKNQSGGTIAEKTISIFISH